jgi:NAD/NADP transhydrogenase beta subunit
MVAAVEVTHRHTAEGAVMRLPMAVEAVGVPRAASAEAADMPQLPAVVEAIMAEVAATTVVATTVTDTKLSSCRQENTPLNVRWAAFLFVLVEHSYPTKSCGSEICLKQDDHARTDWIRAKASANR